MTYIYNAKWLDATRDNIQKERQITESLLVNLSQLKDVSATEDKCVIQNIIDQARLLKRSLDKTQTALLNFSEMSERRNNQIIATYEDAYALSISIFD